jgi:hypothetical protein
VPHQPAGFRRAVSGWGRAAVVVMAVAAFARVRDQAVWFWLPAGGQGREVGWGSLWPKAGLRLPDWPGRRTECAEVRGGVECDVGLGGALLNFAEVGDGLGERTPRRMQRSA